jgi:hypothetical protein
MAESLHSTLRDALPTPGYHEPSALDPRSNIGAVAANTVLLRTRVTPAPKFLI